MKTTIFLSALMSFYFGHVLGQSESHEFGKLSQKEFDIIEYEEDPSAEALVLFDIGLSEFMDYNNSYIIKFTRTRRIKIFKQAGIEFAEVSIPFYVESFGQTESVRSIEAYSYNYENNILNKKFVDLSNAFEESINENWRVKKFVIPDVKEGTIIEYRYVVESPFHFNLPDWEFQDKIPTLYSSYTAHMIPFYEYIYLVQGTNRFSYQNSEVEKGLTRRFGTVEFNDMVHTYVMKDVPAFKDESYMTSVEDYIMKMDFQLAKFTNTRGVTTEVISTWEKLNETYVKHADFGKYIKKGGKSAESILETELKLGDVSDEEKVERIVNYVKNTISWNGINAKFASKSVKDLVNEKNGNAAEINLFLTSMLQSAGIDAKPVLISTRSHGKVKYDYPFSHFFNYVIVLVNVDGNPMITDGTERNIGYDRIPTRCMNEKGLLIQEGDPLWVDLNSQIMSGVTYNMMISVNPEQNTASASVVGQSTEYEAFRMKEAYENDSSKYAGFLHENGFSKITEIKFRNYESPEKPYYYSFSGDIEIEKIDNNLIIKPFISIPPEENKLTQKDRNYPVDFVYPKSVKLKSQVTIPENYQLVDQPSKIKIENDQVALVLQYDVLDNIITLDGEYTFKKSVYQPNEYEQVKFYMRNLVKIFNTPIVLKKDDELN